MKTISQLRQSPANRHQRRIATRFLCLFVGLVLVSVKTQAAELEEYPDVAATPPLALEDLGGNSHTLADYRGKVVLVNFWASWCSPCLLEMPGIQRLKEAMVDTPFAILAVNSKESKSVIWRFRNLLQVNFTLLMDTDGAVAKDWDVQIYPTSYLIDVQGRVRYTAYGEVPWEDDDVRATLRELLEEASSGPAPAD